MGARAGDTGDDSVVEPRFSYVIARLERAVRVAIGERVGPYGLTTSQYTTLSVLGTRGGLSNAQLARRAYMTPQSMSEVIEALESKGLIERAPAPQSRSRAPGDPHAPRAPCARRLQPERSTSSRRRCCATFRERAGARSSRASRPPYVRFTPGSRR